jgi:hypothetical protein
LDCGIVELVAERFLARPEDLDTQTQCLYAFHRFACHAGPRAELLKNPEVSERIVTLAASPNAVVNKTANAVIDALDSFDAKIGAMLRGPRFDAFNREWLDAVAPLE